MKSKITIVTSDGKKWPCRLTLGAMRRFKEETGRDVSSMDGTADMAVLIWCCVVSTCNADGRPLEMSCDDFCDRIDSDEVGKITTLLQNDEKKSTAQSPEKK